MLFNQLVKDLSENGLEELKKATLKNGFSRGHFQDAFDNKHEFSKVLSLYNMDLKVKKPFLVGWGLMVQCLNEDSTLGEYSINFYVKPEFQKRGYGSIIFKGVVKQLKFEGKTGHVCIWSEESDGFYTKNKSDLIRVIIAPKYKKS